MARERPQRIAGICSARYNAKTNTANGSEMIRYTEATRRLAEEHEAAESERDCLGEWYREIKALLEAAPDDRARATHLATLRIIGRAIRSAEQRRNAGCEALYQSSKTDHAAYETAAYERRRKGKPGTQLSV